MEEMLPQENPMGTAKISGLVLKTGLPLMISLLINSLYNFVDSVFVARISEEALTALSLAAPVQIIMSAMGLGIAVGLNAVISRALGEKNQDRVKKTASAALVLASQNDQTPIVPSYPGSPAYRFAGMGFHIP